MVLVAVVARIFCLLARRRLGLSLLELAEVPRGHEGDTPRVRATLLARVRATRPATRRAVLARQLTEANSRQKIAHQRVNILLAR